MTAKPEMNNISEVTDDVKVRVQRTPDERIAELQNKITKAKNQIKTYESKIEEIRNPKPKAPKKLTMKAVLDRAKEAGLSPEDIAKKLKI